MSDFESFKESVKTASSKFAQISQLRNLVASCKLLKSRSFNFLILVAFSAASGYP